MDDKLESILNNLLDTRDITIYMDMVNQVKEKYLIIVSVKDTFGSHIPAEALEKIKDIGFQNISTQLHIMYAGIIDSGNILFDKCSERPDDSIIYDEKINSDLSLYVTSKSWTGGNEAVIKINETDYSLNSRGLNIVIYDCEKNEAVDSVTYDSYGEPPLFYHKNLQFDDDYVNSHFFIPDKYKKRWTSIYEKRYFSDRTLSTKEAEDAIILPNKIINGQAYGGVCDEKFNFLAGHMTLIHRSDDRHIVGSYSVPDDEIEYMDETVVYGGTMLEHIGHLIAECFSDRIWWYVKNPDSHCKIAVATMWGDGSKFVKEFLLTFGLSEEQIIFIEKPTKFKKVIIPEQSFINTELNRDPYDFTQEHVSAFEHMKEGLVPSNYKKIYFTKALTFQQNIFGENYFIDFYKNHGYEIINPEEYSLKEKIQFLMNADEFATQIGTNAHYAIFCKPTVKLTILSRLGFVPLNMQAQIVESAGIKEVYCVDISMNFINMDFALGSSLIGPTMEFRRYAAEVFGEEVDVSTEEYLRNNLYEYIKSFPERYTKPMTFNTIKNLKMLTVLQNMSEVFLGKEFDTSKLDLSTNESILSKQLKSEKSKNDEKQKKIDALNKQLKDLKAENELLKTENKSLPDKNITLYETILTEVHSLKKLVESFYIEKNDLLAEIKILREDRDKLYRQINSKDKQS